MDFRYFRHKKTKKRIRIINNFINNYAQCHFIENYKIGGIVKSRENILKNELESEYLEISENEFYRG